MDNDTQNFQLTQTQTVDPFRRLSLNRPLNVLLKHKDVLAYKNALLRHNKTQDQWHYMQGTMGQGCIPKGIQDQSSFRVSFESTTVQKVCQSLFYFAASRASDVIRTHLKNRIESLRQLVFRLDAKLQSTLHAKEYRDIVTEVSRVAESEREKQAAVHTRKLARDKEIGRNYVSWQTYSKLKQRRNRRLHRPKAKAPRFPSRRLKRKKLRSGAPAPASVLEDSTAPPPVLNLATSKVLTEGHFGIFKKGPKFVPTPFKANFAEFKEDFELWKNKLRWAYHHQNKPESPDGVEDTSQEKLHTTLAEKELIKSQKSRFSAPINKNYALELFLHKLDVEVRNAKEKKLWGTIYQKRSGKP